LGRKTKGIDFLLCLCYNEMTMTEAIATNRETRYEAPAQVDKVRAGLAAAANLATSRELTAYEEQTSSESYAREVADAKGPYADFIEDGLQPHEIEIQRAFEQFNLPRLTVDRLRAMPAGERGRLALHFVAFITFAERHGQVFATDGGPDPHSLMYREHGFESSEQAVEYGHKLQSFARAVKSQAPFNYLEDHTLPHKTPLQLSVMGKRARTDITNHGGKRPTVFVDTKTDKLKLWYE
jgi:hypothetical protein